MDTSARMRRYLVDAHNSVNARTGKEVLSYEAALSAHRVFDWHRAFWGMVIAGACVVAVRVTCHASKSS